MNKQSLLAAGLAALTLLGAGVAAAQPQGGGRPDRNADISRAQFVQRLDARFARLDANGDGSLSAADRAAQVEARFKAIDADHNGAITLDEMKAAEARRGDAFAARGGAGGPGGHHRGGRGHGRGFGGGFGQKADGNGDGAVSKAEFEARALAGFDRADADHNGVLTAAERHQAHGGFGGRKAG